MDLYNGRFVCNDMARRIVIYSVVRWFVCVCCVRARLQLLWATSPQIPTPIISYVTLGPCASPFILIWAFLSFFRIFVAAVLVSFHFISFFRCIFALLSLISLLFTIFHRIVLHDYTRHRWIYAHTHAHTHHCLPLSRFAFTLCIRTTSFATWSCKNTTMG